MKICQIGPGYIPIPPVAAGAVETIIYELSSRYSKKGHEVTIYNITQKEFDFKAKSIFLWNIPIKNISNNFNLLRHLIRGISYSIQSSIHFAFTASKTKYDVVHTHDQFSSLPITILCKLKGIPCIHTVHSYIWLEDKLGLPLKLQFAQEILTFKLTDSLIVTNKTFIKNLSPFLKNQNQKIRWIPLGITITNSKTKTQKSNLIINVARISEYKNQETLLEAISILANRGDLKNEKFLLIGPIVSKKYHEQLLSLIKKYKIEHYVEFTGEASQEQLQKYYKSSKLFVMPSKYEAFGLVMLEAMNQGLPIIASKIAPFREILGEGNTNALFFDSNDPNGLAKVIYIALADNQLRQKLSRNAQKRIKRFSWDTIAQEYLEEYDKISKHN